MNRRVEAIGFGRFSAACPVANHTYCTRALLSKSYQLQWDPKVRCILTACEYRSPPEPLVIDGFSDVSQTSRYELSKDNRGSLWEIAGDQLVMLLLPIGR